MWNHTDEEVEAAIAELTSFRKSDIDKLTSVEALQAFIGAVNRCADLIEYNWETVRRLPMVKDWQKFGYFRAHANTLLSRAAMRLERRREIEAREAARAQRRSAAAARTPQFRRASGVRWIVHENDDVKVQIDEEAPRFGRVTRVGKNSLLEVVLEDGRTLRMQVRRRPAAQTGDDGATDAG